MKTQDNFLIEATESMIAPRRTLLAARLFGKKTKSRDKHVQVTLSHWRGKTYLVGYKDLSPNA